MINASDAVVWTKQSGRAVRVMPVGSGAPDRAQGWRDPIGAHYSQWQHMNDRERVHLMLETAIDLAMQDFKMADVLKQFATVKEFRALGSASYPMCRAITMAVIGKSLEANTMTFEQIMAGAGQ
jgi:hypothetical protein